MYVYLSIVYIRGNGMPGSITTIYEATTKGDNYNNNDTRQQNRQKTNAKEPEM